MGNKNFVKKCFYRTGIYSKKIRTLRKQSRHGTIIGCISESQIQQDKRWSRFLQAVPCVVETPHHWPLTSPGVHLWRNRCERHDLAQQPTPQQPDALGPWLSGNPQGSDAHQPPPTSGEGKFFTSLPPIHTSQSYDLTAVFRDEPLGIHFLFSNEDKGPFYNLGIAKQRLSEYHFKWEAWSSWTEEKRIYAYFTIKQCLYFKWFICNCWTLCDQYLINITIRLTYINSNLSCQLFIHVPGGLRGKAKPDGRKSDHFNFLCAFITIHSKRRVLPLTGKLLVFHPSLFETFSSSPKKRHIRLRINTSSLISSPSFSICLSACIFFTHSNKIFRFHRSQAGDRKQEEK